MNAFGLAAAAPAALAVAGDKRRGLTVEDLLDMFETVRGQELGDDALPPG